MKHYVILAALSLGVIGGFSSGFHQLARHHAYRAGYEHGSDGYHHDSRRRRHHHHEHAHACGDERLDL